MTDERFTRYRDDVCKLILHARIRRLERTRAKLRKFIARKMSSAWNDRGFIKECKAVLAATDGRKART